jgi:chromosome segregation ATPase
VQSRRTHARDRAAQAQSFKTLFAERAAEHATFATAMGDRLTTRERELRELEGTLRLSEARATEAEDRVRRESRRANQAQERVAELEVALAIRTAEVADELASWVPGGYDDMDTVVDLLRWEDRSSAVQDVAPAKKRA